MKAHKTVGSVAKICLHWMIFQPSRLAVSNSVNLAKAGAAHSLHPANGLQIGFNDANSWRATTGPIPDGHDHAPHKDSRVGNVREKVGQEIERHRARLFGFALSLTRRREDADDLLQECALRALTASSIPTDGAATRAWLFRIMRNAWIDQFRRRQVVQICGLDEDMTTVDNPWQGNEALLDSIAVEQALSRLPVAAREVLSLVDMAGFTYAEVAEILEIPAGTVMSRVSRARHAMLAVMLAAVDSNRTRPE